MRVAVHANHRAIEFHLYSLLPDHEFLRFGPDGEMHMRDMPPNCKQMGKKHVIQASPDCAIARNGGMVDLFRGNGIPTIYYLSGPPQPNGQKGRLQSVLARCQAIVCYSKEHRDLWYSPGLPPMFVCHYPIDTDVFTGYEGDIEKALMIATMRMAWWANVAGDWKGVWLLEECLAEGIPFQLIGFNNDRLRWSRANPYPIQTESAMVDCLRHHRLYAHTGSFLCRSPLEAAAVGAPVVIRRTEYSHYHEELPYGTVIRAVSPGEFKYSVERLLDDPEECVARGYACRQLVIEHFHVDVVRKQWEAVLEEIT